MRADDFVTEVNGELSEETRHLLRSSLRSKNGEAGGDATALLPTAIEHPDKQQRTA